MSSDNQSYFYEQYALECYEENEGPPIIDKKSRLLAAVVQNEVGILEDLLDSPEWYNITDSMGLTLLQIAILCDNKEVFDHMLSIPDFPIDFVNEDGSALQIALDGFVSNDIWMSQHFAYELVKKGVSVDVVCLEGSTPLHRALDRSYNQVAILLIEKGVDVNIPDNEGILPLDRALDMYKGVDDVVSALLNSGASATVEIFENSVLQHRSLLAQEVLLLYLFDEYSKIKLGLDVILKLVEAQSPLYYELLKYPFKVKVKNHMFPYFHFLCTMRLDSLKTIIEKFSKQIIQALAKCQFSSFIHGRNDIIFVENLNFMLENDSLRPHMISCIGSLDSFDLFRNLRRNTISETALTQLYCYLLSYGLHINEWVLHEIYKSFGYCELFKILLYMDVEIGVEQNGPRLILATLIYNIELDIDQFIEQPKRYSGDGMQEICKYFAHPEVQRICLETLDARESSRRPNFPQISSLVELTRNAFRKYFIQVFNIRTSRKFYTLLNHLPISSVHKKIISYETSLYDIFSSPDG